jgi:uncharacterized OB-fold protein
MEQNRARVLLFIVTSSDGAEPLAPELFASLEPLTLAGSRCAACATVQFPPARQCAHCAAEEPVAIALPTHGQIWTWTVQRFEPKPPYVAPPGGFVPFAVGYVDLGDVLVESLLLGDPAIGDEVRLVRTPAGGPGAQFTFAFAG